MCNTSRNIVRYFSTVAVKTLYIRVYDTELYQLVSCLYAFMRGYLRSSFQAFKQRYLHSSFLHATWWDGNFLELFYLLPIVTLTFTITFAEENFVNGDTKSTHCTSSVYMINEEFILKLLDVDMHWQCRQVMYQYK